MSEQRPMTEGEAKSAGLGEQRAELAEKQGAIAEQKALAAKGDYTNLTLKEVETAAWLLWKKQADATRTNPDFKEDDDSTLLRAVLEKEVQDRCKELEQKRARGETIDQFTRKEVRYGEWAEWDK